MDVNMTKRNSTVQSKANQYKKYSSGRAYTTDEWVALASKAHKYRYTYEKTEYKTANNYVVVTCPKHGDFEVRATRHLNNARGCTSCFPDMRGRNRKPITHQKFLAKAKKVHGERYCYKKTKYKHSQHKVIITCKLHGDFNQTAERHLRSKYGCQQCAQVEIAKDKTRNTGWFVGEARKKHGEKYDYSKTNYIGSAKALTITCSEHGDFQRTATQHIQGGYGCNQCSGIYEYDTAMFVKRAKEIHGQDKYCYSQSVYEKANNKIKITCSKHGVFEQIAATHLQGSGCKDCAKELFGGYSRSDFVRMCGNEKKGNAILYIIRCYDEHESFYKIGITSNDLQTRFQNRRAMPYSFKEFYLIEGEAGYIYDLEVRLHALLKPWSYKPSVIFRGYTECFSIIKPIDELLRQLSSDNQIQLIA